MIVLSAGALALAQNKRISGTVKGVDGKPIAGAQLALVDAETGAISEIKGAVTGEDGTVKKVPMKADKKKPGRNDPCPCGKLRPNGLPMTYKDCCGKDQ